ncbi:amidohydrolase [Pelagibius litoralis]|uniref:Amidohydrolase n=1 Tax=Pelagibius litoralis TaxID=374515 RepID=A0A967EZS0_9PROT|nr:amidohydrolase [Pelagibius litoralis]NIA70389.1 amidohydrolase [Pelagibius litoralis]
MSRITVYTARKVRTMNPSFPEAEAVAVRDGRIVEVGTLDSMKPWLGAHEHVIDDRFKDHVLMPGFIDPHIHPAVGGVLLPSYWITAMEWQLPDRISPAIKTHEGYLERLGEIERSMDDPDEVLLTWGFHKIWHGDVFREQLNEISQTRPVFVLQRSFHEAVTNDAGLDWLEAERSELERHHQIDLETGRFFETGLAVLFQSVNKITLNPERFARGLEMHKRMVHLGGHTTVGDMAYPMMNHDFEWEMLSERIDRDDVPFRMKIVPRGALRGDWNGSPTENLARVNEMETLGTHRLRFGNAVKLFADGGFNAELMQLLPPGYIDGHHGEWLVAPEYFRALAEQYWKDGKQIHVHCTGDMGLELALTVLEDLLAVQPRFNHRFTIEHCGVSTPEQAGRIRDLGAIVSAAVYYVHELGEAYWHHSIGYERAFQMSRMGTLERLGITTAFHSDFVVSPPQPLHTAWVAVNRFAESGAVLGERERTSLDFAMRAITIDAAYVLNMENEIGSIRAGKLADFTVLEADPWETPLEDLKDIPIWGTVFEGRPFPVEK